MKTKFINDVGLVQVLMETDNAGAVQATYNYGNDLISMRRADANSFYHYDGLETVKQLSDEAGAVVASYVYDSFGNSVSSVSSVANNYGFTGVQQFGEADNLVYLRARYYNPSVGRFISRDPIGYEDSMSLYVYVKNNPVNLRDPLGKSVQGVACAICAAMYLYELGSLIYNCIDDSRSDCPTWGSIGDCLRNNLRDALTPDTPLEEIVRDASCFICLGPILRDIVGPIFGPEPLPIGIR